VLRWLGCWVCRGVAAVVAVAAVPATAAAITVTIDSGPANPSDQSVAQFVFHSSGASGNVFYRCTIDGGGPNGCSSPQQYSSLHNGNHSFTVRAVDSGGANALAEYSWTISDLTPPETVITSGPSDPTASSTATFEFTSSEPGSTFVCSLDGGPLQSCVSPKGFVGIAPGQHTFSVAATDVNGNTDATAAQRTWTAVAPGTLVDGHPVHAQVSHVPIHGPITLRGKRFARMLARGHHRRDIGVDNADEPAEPPQPPPPCQSTPCSTTGGENVGLAPSGPMKTVFDSTLRGGIDWGIAASEKSFLLLSDQGTVGFYDKAGQKLTTDANGNPLPYANPIANANFFQPLLAVINNVNTLNLDGQFAAKNPDGSLVYGLDYIYDTRIIWDSYRNRFWIVAQAKSNQTQQNKKGTVPQATLDYRRDKILAAVSNDADPRDGFSYWWWDAMPGDGSCTDSTLNTCPQSYKPGYGADYVSIGISKHAFVEMELAGTNKAPGHQFDVVNVFRPDKMVSNKCNTPACSWSYWDIAPADGSAGVVRGSITAVQQHGSSPSNRQFIAGTESGNTLSIYSFLPDDPYPPQLKAQSVGVRPFVPTQPFAQPPGQGNASPKLVNLGSNLFGDQVIHAVYRNGKIWALKPECFTWADQSSCAPAIRLIRVDAATNNLEADRSFGERGPGDPNNALVGYGWPWMEVNKFSNLAVGYQRSGAGVFPEARYSLWLLGSGDTDIRPSHVIRKGKYPLGVPLPANPSSDDLKPVGRLDLTGASVDPFDDAGVWLIQGYAKKDITGSGSYQPVVAKVMGDVYSDLVAPLRDIRAIAGQSRLTISGRVLNEGDGKARSVSLTAFLLSPNGRGRGARLARVTLNSVASGAVKRFHFRVRAPSGRHRVKLVLAVGRGREYDRHNDVTTTKVVSVR
jgi:hypothetical protein